MIRKLLTLLLLLGVYLVLTVFALEVGLRLFQRVPPAAGVGFFWRAPDAVTGWALEPGAAGRWYNPMYEYNQYININELGLRSPADIGYDKPEGVYRILLLGDSFVEGLHVALEDTFGQRLGRALNEAGANADGKPVQVEVVDGGVSGWGTDQQLLWLREEGYKYDPDLILLAFFPGNDFMNNYMPLEFANVGSVRKPWYELVDGRLQLNDYPFDPDQTRASRQRLRAEVAAATGATTDQTESNSAGSETAAGNARPLEWLGDGLQQVSALYRYVDPRLRRVAPHTAAWLASIGLLDAGQESSDLAQGPAYIPVTYGVYGTPPAAPWPQAFATTGALLDEFKREADRLGAPVRALLIPSADEVDPQQWTRILQSYPAMQGKNWDLGQPAAVAAAALAAAQIPAVDLGPAFRQQLAEGRNLHLRDDGHWTADGHAVAAAALATWLTSDPSGGALSVQKPIPGLARPWGHLVWRIFVWSIVAVLVISLVWSIYKDGPRVWLRNAGLNLGTAGELLVFFVRRQHFVLLPLVFVLLAFGGLLILAQASLVGPFIYTLF
jgi:lysophospholipase L1-like esterase